MIHSESASRGNDVVWYFLLSTGQCDNSHAKSNFPAGHDSSVAVTLSHAALVPGNDDTHRQDDDVEDDETNQTPDVEVAAREAVILVVLATNTAMQNINAVSAPCEICDFDAYKLRLHCPQLPGKYLVQLH